MGDMSKKDTAHAEIATPIQTIGTIKRVVQGLYSYGKPASAKSIAPHIGMNYTEIGKTFSDARTLGLVAPAFTEYSRTIISLAWTAPKPFPSKVRKTFSIWFAVGT